MSNFNDFDVLRWTPVSILSYTNNIDEMGRKPSIILLPGSKEYVIGLYKAQANGMK